MLSPPLFLFLLFSDQNPLGGYTYGTNSSAGELLAVIFIRSIPPGYNNISLQRVSFSAGLERTFQKCSAAPHT
ncbi:hypothetical protein SUGI_0916390 [Cryptomeria japonica]|nr:hypothetical protein SUGI_0916390 [Cryptomeria japonica]